MTKLARRIADGVLWSFFALLPLVGGCHEKPTALEGTGNPALADKDFDDGAEVDDDGTTVEDDEGDDIDLEGNEDTVDEPTRFVCQIIDVSDVSEDAAPFAEDAGAVLRITADHEVQGTLAVSFRVHEWTGVGFDAETWAVLVDRPGGTVGFARGHDVTVDEETGDTWVTVEADAEDMGANFLLVPLGVHLAGDTSADGDPDVWDFEATDVADTVCTIAGEAQCSGTLAVCSFQTDWDPTGADLCEVVPVVRGDDLERTFTWGFTCGVSTEEGPSLLLTFGDCTLFKGETGVTCEDDYVVHIFTQATCTGLGPVTLDDISGIDQCDLIDLELFGDNDTSNGFCAVLAYEDGEVLVNLEDGTIMDDLDHIPDDRIGGVAVSTGSALQATQVDAVISYGNDGYGITHYDPAFGEFGATEIDPSSGSVSDVDTYEEDPSRAVLVQSGRNQVRFIELMTDPFSGSRFRTVDTLVKNIPSTLFPGATGYVITATRRNDTSPVYFVTVGATPTDPGQLWRKNDPAALLTPATLVGSVGNAPRRIRFAGPVGVVSNNGSNTLTILTRDASDNVAIKGTVNVGDGPIGLDLLVLPNGNIGVLSTGYRDNTYTVTIVEPDGDVVSNETSPVPTGGLNPSSAVWANAEGTRVAVSCHGSNKLVIFSIG